MSASLAPGPEPGVAERAPSVAPPRSLVARLDGALARALGKVSPLGLSGFSRDVAGTLGARVAASVLGFATAALGARLLGPGGWGTYAVALAVTSLVAQFGNLGLHSANTYHVTRDPALTPALAANSLVVSVSVSGLALLLAPLATLRPGLVAVNGLVLGLALLGVPFLLATIFLRALLLGLGDVRAYNLAEVLPPATVLVLVGLLALGGVAMPLTVVAAGVTGLAAGAGVAGLALRRHVGVVLRPSLTLFRTTFHFGARAYVAAFFSYALLRIDLLMVNGLTSATKAGLYAAAVSFADGLYLVPTVMGAMLFPRLVRLPASDRWRVTRRLAWRLAALLAVAAAAAAALARPALELVYGGSFASAAPAFRILALAAIFIGTNTVLSNHLAAGGFPLAVIAIWGVAAAANVALNAALIPGRGIEGAAFASLLCYGFVLAAQYGYARRRAPPAARARGSFGLAHRRGSLADAIVRAVPLDRERLLCIGRDGGAVRRALARRRPWVRVFAFGPDSAEDDTARTAAGAGSAWPAGDAWDLPFGSGSFDCVVTGSPECLRSGRCLAEIRRVLREGGALVSVLVDAERSAMAVAGGEDGAAASAREILECAGLSSVQVVAAPRHRRGSHLRLGLVRSWKRAAPCSELERAREAMAWVYRRLEPDVSPDDAVCAEDFLAAGRALCWGYSVALGELLQREGYRVSWITMAVFGHPLGRGGRAVDSHEVLEVRADGRDVLLDPMCDTVIPCSLREVLAQPSRAVPKANPDKRYIGRGYAFYDTAAWYARVRRVVHRRSRRRPVYPWSWRPVRPGALP